MMPCNTGFLRFLHSVLFKKGRTWSNVSFGKNTEPVEARLTGEGIPECAFAGKPGGCENKSQGCQKLFSPLNLRSRKHAALISARCVNACGVLPMWRA